MVQFSDSPQTEWLTTQVPDRTMQLLREFWFEDRAGKRWVAMAGTVIDGASIPQALWTLVGSPYTGQYRRASIVHDIACVNAPNGDERRAADRMFFEACRAGGCSEQEAMVLYSGVRVGSVWATGPATMAAPTIKAFHPAIDKRLEADFQLVVDQTLAPGPTDDPFEVEARVDNALITVATLPPS